MKRSLGVGHVFQDFEHGHDVEGVVGERHVLGVHLERGESGDAAVADGLQIGDALIADVDGGDGEFGKCIEERPKESAAPAADVEKRLRREAAEDAEDALDTRECRVVFEFVETEAGAVAVVDGRVARVEASADKGGGQVGEVAIHL